MPTPHDPPVPFAPDLHDSRHLWLKAVLLLIWALVAFGVCGFADALHMPLGEWPLGYWVACQGAVLVFIALIVLYCLAMNHFERQAPQAPATDLQ